MSAEVVQAISHGSDAAVTIHIDSREPFYAGGAEEKWLLRGTVDGQAASLVERSFLGEEYVAIWKQFRNSDIPTLPDIYTSERDTLIVPDMKADNSEFYGKSLQIALAQGRRHRERPQSDAHFIELISQEETKAQIEAAAYGLGAVAAQAGIILPAEDPIDLQVHADGTWKLMALDVDSAAISDTTTGHAQMVNEALMWRFLDIDLPAISASLRHPETPRNPIY